MSKIIIMQGLPGSGKSTRAREIIRSSGNYIRLNRDLLRTMLHFDKWSLLNEEITIDVLMTLAKRFVENNRSFIIDDTNLGNTLNKWINFANTNGCNYEVIKMNTSIDECISRDNERFVRGERFVGKNVIMLMARQYRLFDNGKKDIICDLDGTLCNIKHRLRYVTKTIENEDSFVKKNWKEFFAHISEDTPRQEVLDILNHYKDTHNICFVSGRPDTYKKETEEWLSKYFPIYNVLLMRRGSDARPDDEVKEDILNNYFIKENIEMVIDDRRRVIKMWEKNGLKVINVGGENNDF